MHGASQRTLALRNGAQVLLRPILSEDKPLLKDAFDRLGEDSRHRRFFSPIKELDAAALAYLCEVDHHDHEAVVAIDKTAGTALGVARYVRSSEDPVVAEAAVTVIDDWQGIGLGRVLLTRLATRARYEGITHFIATVKTENRAAIELLEGLGNSRHAGEGSELTVVIDLPKRGIGAALERVLRLAASGPPIVSGLQSPRGAAVATSRPKTPADGALDSVVAQLTAGLGAAIETATGLIFAEIPAYAALTDPDDREDVHTHLREHYEAALDSFREQRQVTREDLLFIRRHAALRVEHVSVADFIAAFHLGQRVLWERTLALAGDDQSRRAALGLVTYIARYFEIATTHAAEVYLEAEQLLATTAERRRRDALEDLLARSESAANAHLQVLRDAGLEPRGSCLVISAIATTQPADENTLRSAASALARSLHHPVAPLTVLRHDEIVIVAPAPTNITATLDRLADVQRRLTERGTQLAIGVSTIHHGLGAVADAYREASASRNLLANCGGLVALPTMSAFDYLTMHSDATARRLVPAAIEQFIREDIADGGALVATVNAYAAANLNVKQAAAQLHIHVNTAHYRLARVAERTGTDLRRTSDVIELLIAARLADGPSNPPQSSRNKPSAAT